MAKKRRKLKFARVELLLSETMYQALLHKAERDGQRMGAVVKSILAIALRDQIERIEREKSAAVTPAGD